MRRTLSGKLNKVQLLTLLRPRNMRGNKRVHKRLEIRPPPLRKRIPNLPLLIDALSRELIARGSQPLVQPHLEPLHLVILGLEIVARQLEEGVRDLQHQDVRVVVFVANKDPFAGSAHAVLGVVLF